MCKVNLDQPNARYVNPMTDFGFKKIFGDAEVMTAFLTDLLKPESPIADITFIDTNMMGDNKAERGVIYDLRCRMENGGEFIVEMQNKRQIHFADRILFYLSRSIAPQGDKGIAEVKDEATGEMKRQSWNFELCPVYGIFFLNFHLKDLKPYPLRTVKMMVEETGEVFTEKVRAYTIELPGFEKTEEECESDLDYWTYIMNNMEALQTSLPFAGRKPIFSKIETLASLASMPTEEREQYQRSLDHYRTIAATYECEHEQGREEGRAEGRAEGIEIGLKQGREEGRAEKIASAKRFLAAGYPKDFVLSTLGVTIEELD